MMERSGSRRGALGRTQSAVSHSLARLRGQLGDPLLIKAGVRMQPTAFALDLIEQTRPMLRGIQRVLSPRYVFDPAHSQRLFRVAAPDFMLTVFAHLLSRLRSEAPGVSAEWTAPREPTLLDIAEGQIDVAIVLEELRLPEGVASEAVGSLGWRCFARKDHPAVAKWSRRPGRNGHISWFVGDSLTSPVNVAASDAGLERRIAGWVPNFSAIAPVLANSDLLATLPVVAMAETMHVFDLESREVPFPIAPLPHAMVWSTTRSRDPAMIWLRDRLRPIVKRNFAGS
jgi:DNA-binding transcriptional LysR family regulator